MVRTIFKQRKKGRPKDIYPSEKIWNMLKMLATDRYTLEEIGDIFNCSKQYVHFIKLRWKEDFLRLKKE
tara:strand:- start:57 stop:263 length:207 start_codon:yes stop_codon:yes gene_type:complete